MFFEVHDDCGTHFANLTKFDDICLDNYTITGYSVQRHSNEDVGKNDILYHGEHAPQIMQKIKEALESQNLLITPDDFSTGCPYDAKKE